MMPNNAVLALNEKGYKPPVREKIPVVGETGYATLLLAAQSMKASGFLSDHDLKIAKKLAYVIAGGEFHLERKWMNNICWIWKEKLF